MRDRTYEFRDALLSESKSNDQDPSEIRLAPFHGTMIPRTPLARECNIFVQKTARKKRELEIMAAEVCDLTGGYEASLSRGAPSNAGDALEELEATELEALAFCAQADRRLIGIGQSLGKTKHVLEYPIGGMLPRKTLELHISGMVAVTMDFVASLTHIIQNNKRARKLARETAQKLRNRGAFATVSLSARELQEMQAESNDFADVNDKGLIAENKQLQKRLEVKGNESMELSEGKLLEISAMMTAFNEKVYQQHETVDAILETEQAARDYTEAGVKQLMSAEERSRGQQIWMLSILFMASFSILFLDWYGA
ncbi:hypothetical protein AAMO2058_001751200 [Amorphochlora amoebiformis]